MKIYDFDVEDEIQKIEDNLRNVELIKNSFADNTLEYRKLSLNIDLDFSVLSDCIESYERALLMLSSLLKIFIMNYLKRIQHKIFILGIL